MHRDAFITGIIRSRRAVLAVAALATVAAVYLLLSRGLREDYRLEAFVASSDASYERFRAFMEEFTSNEFAVVAVHGQQPLNDEMEALLADLGDELRELPAVQRASSIVDVPALARAALGDRLLDHPLISGNLLSADHRTAAILCQMAGEGGDGTQRRETVAAMKSLVASARAAHPDYQIILTGPYVTLIDMYAYVDRDLMVFSILSFALTLATMWAVFRRVPPMGYAAGVAACAILCTLGITIPLGIVSSLITQMIVILVIVLAVANCVHLAVSAEETADAAARSPVTRTAHENVRATLGRMVWPCTAVMVTTAAGFASVCISDIAPVRRFGGLMAFGLLLALVVSLAGVATLQRATGARRVGADRLAGALERCGRHVLDHAWRYIALFAVGIGVVAWGAHDLRFESDFVKNFRPGSEVRESYHFIERHLSPLGSVEVVARRPDGRSAATAKTLAALDAFADRAVDDFPMIEKALTPTDALSLMVPGEPATDAEVRLREAALRMAPGGTGILRNFINAAGDALRVNFRCTEGYDVNKKLEMCAELERRAAAAVGEQYTVEVTGLYHFYARLVAGLLRDQYRALGLTVAVIFVVIWIMLRSLRWTLIAMTINLLPVVFCLGAMGWADIPVNMTTAMMLSATLGIAVDDTLHYIWRFRREFAACGEVNAAIIGAHRGVGRACVFTTVVIAGGFSILLLSQFLPTAYFGGLVGVTMLAALAADLLLLPALIALFPAEQA